MVPESHRIDPPAAELADYHRTARGRTVHTILVLGVPASERSQLARVSSKASNRHCRTAASARKMPFASSRWSSSFAEAPRTILRPYSSNGPMNRAA